VHGGSSVFVRLDIQTRQWTLFDFAIKNQKFSPHVLDGNNLIICTYEYEKNAQGQIEFELKFYNFLIR
jgi:hypothetical protein